VAIVDALYKSLFRCLLCIFWIIFNTHAVWRVVQFQKFRVHVKYTSDQWCNRRWGVANGVVTHQIWNYTTNKRKLDKWVWFFLKFNIFDRGGQCGYSTLAPKTLATPLRRSDFPLFHPTERTWCWSNFLHVANRPYCSLMCCRQLDYKHCDTAAYMT
jgi:hypothetical protein